MKINVFKYLNLKPTEKLEIFMETQSSLSFVPSYWFDFKNVRKNIGLYDTPELYTLDYLIGKSEIEIDSFFRERPKLLLLIPYLLGIREQKFENPKKDRILNVQGTDGIYKLNFKDIEEENIENYLKFINDSGLVWLFQSGIKKSIHDYSIGVEAGMDSNGRKNRSGSMGELYLEDFLQEIAEERGWLYHGQTTWKTAKRLYNLELDETFGNRIFDGSLYNIERQKLYLFEVNNFNSGGSKSKASATEFKDLQDRFSRTNHEFIYITDGAGWDTDSSHLVEAMRYIGKVFNYRMIEDGYLKDYLG